MSSPAGMELSYFFVTSVIQTNVWLLSTGHSQARKAGQRSIIEREGYTDCREIYFGAVIGGECEHIGYIG